MLPEPEDKFKLVKFLDHSEKINFFSYLWFLQLAKLCMKMSFAEASANYTQTCVKMSPQNCV